MRLVDADKIGLTDFEIIMCNGDYKKALELLLGKIRNQPTAYDIDKVVEEFDKKYNNPLWIKGNEEFSITRNELLEIVKRGCESDDVCEWRKYLNHPFDWLVGCEYGLIASKQGDYCPYCGKKIKVVE